MVTNNGSSKTNFEKQKKQYARSLFKKKKMLGMNNFFF